MKGIKRNRIDIVLYYPDGARYQIKTLDGKSMTYVDMGQHCQNIADICRRLESEKSVDAVDPSAADPGTPSTRAKSFSHSPAVTQEPTP